MKKYILLLILIIIPFHIFGAWASSVKAVWLLENNLTDSSGNSNNAESYGGAYSYSSTIKYEGSYSLYSNNIYSYCINTGRGPTAPPPSALTTLISADTTGFWAEAWVYDMGTGARHLFGTEGLQPPVLALTTDGTNAFTGWNNTSVNIGYYNVNTEKQTWIHWAYTYNRATDTLKIYKNGSLIYTRTSAGDMVAGNRALLFGMSWNQASNAYFDRVIVGVGAVPETFPTDPLVDTTPTITETITQTITATITQTVTETITETITKTVTQTITETITETITKTVTQTITLTVTETVTETITETITETATPTITQTSTITTTITRTATATATTTRRPYPSITPTRTMTPRGTPKAIWTYKSPTPTRTPYIRVLSTPRARYATVTPTPTLYWW